MVEGSSIPSVSGSHLDFPTTGSGMKQWQAYYQKVELERLDSLLEEKGHTGLSFFAVMGLMFFMQQFMEDFQLYNQGRVENALSQIGNLRDKIEQQFDAIKGVEKGSLSGEVATHNALVYYYGGRLWDEQGSPTGAKVKGIVQYLDQYQKEGIFTKSFVGNFESNFVDSSDGGVFGKSGLKPGEIPSTDELIQATDNLYTAWWSDWNPTDPSPPSSVGGKGKAGDPTSVQPVTNALTAATTQITSMSNTAQSKIKYYESWDEQYKSMMHDVMSEVMNEEKKSSTAMQSAGS